METNQYTSRDVISRALLHVPAATQKGVADLCLYQMHVHTGINDFRYVAINTYNLAACAQ